MGATRGNESGLAKTHTAGCPNAKGRDLTKCDCSWRGRYKRNDVLLAKWARVPLKPREKKDAVEVLRRLKVAIDGKTFDPAGEVVALGTGQTFAAFIDEYITHHVEKHEHTSNSTGDVLKVIKASPLGALSLEYLAGTPSVIQAWLDARGKGQGWKAKTWNNYHGLLFNICKKAIQWKRMTQNPMALIDTQRKKNMPAQRERRLEEPDEAALFAACDKLNRVQHKPNRTQLTMEKADQIRARVAAGERQVDVAKAYQVQPSTICAIIKGDTFNPAKYHVGTKGTEMKRRLMAAFDMGARAGEMLDIQIAHVNWRAKTWREDDGTIGRGYEIDLPPELTKGGKTTGEYQTLFACTPRLVLELDRRRLALDNDPKAFLFGTEEGWRVDGFKKLWHELFTLAGLDFGREKGLVWHSTRHEFISRIAEKTGDVVLCQKLARHKRLETTQGYMHARRESMWRAASGR